MQFLCLLTMSKKGQIMTKVLTAIRLPSAFRFGNTTITKGANEHINILRNDYFQLLQFLSVLITNKNIKLSYIYPVKGPDPVAATAEKVLKLLKERLITIVITSSEELVIELDDKSSIVFTATGGAFFVNGKGGLNADIRSVHKFRSPVCSGILLALKMTPERIKYSFEKGPNSEFIRREDPFFTAALELIKIIYEEVHGTTKTKLDFAMTETIGDPSNRCILIEDSVIYYGDSICMFPVLTKQMLLALPISRTRLIAA